MEPYIYEIIEHEIGEPKVFIAAVSHSCHHWHYDHELILVLKGAVVLSAEGECHVLKDGDFYWINSQTVHSIHQQEDNLCLFIQMSNFLFYNGSSANRNYSFYLNSLRKDLAPRNGFIPYRQLAARIGLEHLKGENANIHRIRSYIYEFMANMIDYAVYDIHQSPSYEQENNPRLLMQIIDYTQKEYRSESVIKDAQKKFGMSEKTMYRFLKKYLGLSLKDLVMETRLEQARAYLRNTDKPISYIAEKCGFGSDTTFFRAFRKSMGITPAEYRKNDLRLDLPEDRNVQGYMSYNPMKAHALLSEMAGGEGI